jgi:protoporphyrinogen oxidase
MARTAIIIGAGPAGLTAAYELLTRTDIKPIILEKSPYLGGLARTLNHHGNRIDIGPHRFFSKSDRVMDRWAEILPLQATKGGAAAISYHQKSREVSAGSSGPDPDQTDKVLLIRPRTTRIYFLRKLFDYPIKLTKETLLKLGFFRVLRIGFSYLRSFLFPIRNEKNLEEFFINRFGRELYLTFFKSYTEKVWGVPCRQIDASWGAQRIKGLSIIKTIQHFLEKLKGTNEDLGQKKTETSLVEQFLYPKLGAGQMWEELAAKIVGLGGEIRAQYEVMGLKSEGFQIRSLQARDLKTGQTHDFEGDFFFSSMPVQELLAKIEGPIPGNVKEISRGLQYRDMLLVSLLLKTLRLKDEKGGTGLIRDNWIYIQEHDVQMGRLQIANNMSPYLVKDPSQVWVGLEYFCYQGDPVWSQSDGQIAQLGIQEMARIGLIEPGDVLDSLVTRVEKTYPAYFGTYNRFQEIIDYLERFPNLFPIGRNGMHKYNNQDHSMLTAMVAVDNIVGGRKDKSNLWEINTEEEYQETKE